MTNQETIPKEEIIKSIKETMGKISNGYGKYRIQEQQFLFTVEYYNGSIHKKQMAELIKNPYFIRYSPPSSIKGDDEEPVLVFSKNNKQGVLSLKTYEIEVNLPADSFLPFHNLAAQIVEDLPRDITFTIQPDKITLSTAFYGEFGICREYLLKKGIIFTTNL